MGLGEVGCYAKGYRSNISCAGSGEVLALTQLRQMCGSAAAGFTPVAPVFCSDGMYRQAWHMQSSFAMHTKTSSVFCCVRHVPDVVLRRVVLCLA